MFMQNQDHYTEHTINEQSTPHFGIFLSFFLDFYFIVFSFIQLFILFLFVFYFILFVFIRFLNAWKI